MRLQAPRLPLLPAFGGDLAPAGGLQRVDDADLEVVPGPDDRTQMQAPQVPARPAFVFLVLAGPRSRDAISAARRRWPRCSIASRPLRACASTIGSRLAEREPVTPACGTPVIPAE